MTINSQANKSIVAGDGIQTQFGFSFVGVNAQYISVILTDAGGNETLLSRGNGATQYQIALNAPVQGALWGLGGTVTYNPGGVPIPAGSTLTIVRTLPLTQAVSLQGQSSLETLGDGAETGLDTLEMQLQQISEKISRAILMNVTNASPPSEVPPAAQIAGKGAIFSADGLSLVAGDIPATGFISTAMAPVVGAASLALARAAFGLGAMAVEGIGGGLADDGAGNVRVSAPTVPVAVNQVIDDSRFMTRFIATGAINFSLNRANTLWNGFGFFASTFSGPVDLVPNVNDAIGDKPSGATFRLPAGGTFWIYTNGNTSGSWYVEAASNTAMPVTGGSASGLAISNNVGTPNTKIDVSANEIVIGNSTGGAIRAAAPAFTIDLNVVGLNGLDAGIILPNNWVNIFAISDGLQVGGLASYSLAPTMPAGFSFVKRLGAMRIDGFSHLLRSIQKGRRAQYKITAGTTTSAFPLMDSGVRSPSFQALPVAVFVPPTASEIEVIIVNQYLSGALSLIGVEPNTDYAGGTTGNPPLLYCTAAQQVSLRGSMVLEGPNIYWTSSASGGAIMCSGWTDNL